MIRRLALVAAAALALPAAAGAQTAPLNNPPRQIAEGQTFLVGGGPTGGDVRYFLSADARLSPEDVRLLQPSPSAPRRVMVPSMPAGRYRLLACTGPRCVSAPARIAVSEGPISHIQAFSDTTDLSQTDSILTFDEGYQPTICPAPHSQRAPSYPAALAGARALVRHAATGQTWRAFTRSSVYRSADEAESAAAEAVMVGKPGTALAATLRAAELAPTEPRYVIDGAALITQLGAPDDALALLQHADALRLSGSQPFGINEQALALNARGAALLALGHPDQAETVLRAALTIEPLLKEANLNLSVALLCQRRGDTGLHYLRAGQLRQPVITSTGVGAPPLDQQLDMTHGVTPTLPSFPKPTSFEQAAAMWPMFKSLDLQLRAEIDAADERHLPRTFASDDPSQLTVQRSLDLQRLLNYPPAELQTEEARVNDLNLQAEEGAAEGMSTQLTKDEVGWESAAGDACANLRPRSESAYQACFTREVDTRCLADAEPMTTRVVQADNTAEQATDAFLTRWYQYATALAANDSDPFQHDLLMDRAEGSLLRLYEDALEPLYHLAAFANSYNGCSAATVDVPGAPPGPTLPHSEPCPASIKGVKLGWKLGADKSAGIPFDLSIDVNCEKVSLEVGGSVSGWFGAFGQLDYSPRTGKLSVFAGPKASAKIPGTTIGASFKDGLYLSIKNGGVDDFGFRTSASGNDGFGPFSIKGGDSMDFSFAPVFGLRN